jgi:hypothetical protein
MPTKSMRQRLRLTVQMISSTEQPPPRDYAGDAVVAKQGPRYIMAMNIKDYRNKSEICERTAGYLRPCKENGKRGSLTFFLTGEQVEVIFDAILRQIIRDAYKGYQVVLMNVGKITYRAGRRRRILDINSGKHKRMMVRPTLRLEAARKLRDRYQRWEHEEHEENNKGRQAGIR